MVLNPFTVHRSLTACVTKKRIPSILKDSSNTSLNSLPDQAYDAWEHWLVYGVMGLALTASLIQFLYNRSLWFDEALLALNIMEKSSGELLKPLDLNQVAPILYLQITKLFSLLTPNAEYGLRLFPLICYWASLILFYKMLRLLFRENILIVVALCLFAFNHTIMYYSSEVKQYMVDVLVSVTFLYLVINYDKNRHLSHWFLGVAGVFAIFLSSIAPIILLSSGMFLFWRAWSGAHRKQMINLFVTGIVWLIVFVGYFYLFIHDHPTREYMLHYWSREGAFLPQNIFSPETYHFFREKMMSQGHFAYAGFWGVLVGFLMVGVAGFVFFLRKGKPWMVLFIIAPAIIHLTLSALQLYPFGRRLTLYLMPQMVVFGVFGLQLLVQSRFLKDRKYLLRVVGLLVPVIAIGLLLGNFPLQREEIKQSLRFIKQNSVPEQHLYASRGAIPALRYYEKTGFVDSGLFQQRLEGTWMLEENTATLNLLIDKGEGFWLLLSHYSNEESLFYLEYLKTRGLVPGKRFKATGTAVYFVR